MVIPPRKRYDLTLLLNVFALYSERNNLNIKNVLSVLECSLGVCWSSGSADIYLLKVSNKKARTGYAICSKLTIKTRHGVKVGPGTLGPGPGTPLKV